MNVCLKARDFASESLDGNTVVGQFHPTAPPTDNYVDLPLIQPSRVKKLFPPAGGEKTNKKTYRSGQQVPQTGLYRVVHYQHRLPHNSVMRKGDAFPLCNKCGGRVAFSLSETIHSLNADEDFTLEAA